MDQHLAEEFKEEANDVVRRLQGYWMGMLVLPLLYLLACLAIGKYWFDRKGIDGLSPLSRDGAIVFWTVLGIAALTGSCLILNLEERFSQWLDEAADDPLEFFRLLSRRLLILGAICDVVSFLGVIYFLVDANIMPMAATGAYGYMLYAQIYPHKKVLKKLRLEASAKSNGSSA